MTSETRKRPRFDHAGCDMLTSTLRDYIRFPTTIEYDEGLRGSKVRPAALQEPCEIVKGPRATEFLFS